MFRVQFMETVSEYRICREKACEGLQGSTMTREDLNLFTIVIYQRQLIQLFLSPQSKADFGTVEIEKEHGGFGASELIQTRDGITESEPFLRILGIGLSSRVSI
ncbi:hypothetical protein TNCV_4365381 [Trichonephila clavipes]|nr:hypothetical protein TNCV_4365381 [Trichonephila clavipes]